MHARRFGSLLLAVLLALSTLEDAVDARRTITKCCASDEQLYFSEDSGQYKCEMSPQKEKDKETIPVHNDDADADYDVDGGNTTMDFYSKLAMLSNFSLTRDDVRAGVKPSCAPDDTDYLLELKGSQLHVTPATVRLRTPGQHEFDAHAWCLDLDEEGDIMAVVCPCAGVDMPCVRKCCHPGEAFDWERTVCVVSDPKSWIPTPRDSNMKFYQLLGKIPTCEFPSIERFHRSQLAILSDGSMKGHDISGRATEFPSGRFCVDATNSSNASDTDGDHMVLFCIETDALSDAVTIFKGVVTLLGAVALLITVVLTVIFPEMRQNIHGKMALCHNSSLLVAFVCIGATQVSGNTMDEVTCKVLSFVMQYTLLAAFFWLNVMCVEVSWVFSALRPVKKVMAGYVDSKFRWYSVYAWGTTSLISIITMLVEFVPGAKFKPRFGEANCFFHGDDMMPQLLFLFGPMAILLSINVGLFVFTATKIITHRRQTSILKTNDSNTNNRNNQNLILYLKLFTLMGVTWIFEIISWAVGGKNYYWLIIDCVNLLRGVFIFFVFCCKRSVLDLVRARLGCAAAKEGSQSSAGTKSTAPSNEGHEMTDTSAAARRTSDLR